jgi:hypothetical protein
MSDKSPLEEKKQDRKEVLESVSKDIQSKDEPFLDNETNPWKQGGPGGTKCCIIL